ncbi:hypothetical protein ACWPLX_000908 [Escherichia coli]
MRKDVIMRALPLLGERIKFCQEIAEEELAIYQLRGDEYHAEWAAKHQHEANALAELYDDLAAELDRQRQQ